MVCGRTPLPDAVAVRGEVGAAVPAEPGAVVAELEMACHRSGLAQGSPHLRMPVCRSGRAPWAALETHQTEAVVAVLPGAPLVAVEVVAVERVAARIRHRPGAHYRSAGAAPLPSRRPACVRTSDDRSRALTQQSDRPLPEADPRLFCFVDRIPWVPGHAGVGHIHTGLVSPSARLAAPAAAVPLAPSCHSSSNFDSERSAAWPR